MSVARKLDADAYLQFAGELADAAGEAIRPWFRSHLQVERKGDGSPVTQADRAAETAIRERICSRFPHHGIVGEEFGAARTDAEWVWVIDPIDGTGAFISGLPTFGTLIGLVWNGVPVLGVLDQPISAERWTGLDFPDISPQTTHNSNVVQTSSTTDLGDSIGFASNPAMFKGPERDAWDRLASSLYRARYGIDCYAYGLLASGFADIVCEASLKAWDYMALVPIVRGAGGQITDWNGGSLTLASQGRVLASASPGLHRAALDRLRE